MHMTASDALGTRMRNLLLAADVPPAREAPWTARPAGEAPGSVADVVTWFGAMQAQDLGSALWSLGARLPGWTRDDVHQALERREALRTWPMRGTVHLVPARDARWMLELMGRRPLAGAVRRRAVLGLAEATADLAVDVLGAALAGGGRLTRSGCVQALQAGGVEVTGGLAYHLLWYASQRGVTCIGPDVDGEQTFVLLDDWVTDPHRPDEDEALATVTTRYVRSHGPVPRADLAGWTGLSMTEVKRGVAAAGPAVQTVDVEDTEMLVCPEALDVAAPPPSDALRPLPGFDEYVLGYKDRSLMMEPAHLAAIVPGGNGIFRSTLVRAGRVVATWTKRSTPARTTVDVKPLVPQGELDPADVEAAFASYACFLMTPVRVSLGGEL